jgi:hypothetical protein
VEEEVEKREAAVEEEVEDQEEVVDLVTERWQSILRAATFASSQCFVKDD